MIILGINGSTNLVDENYLGIGEGVYHDSGAAIVKDGILVAAFEEERLNRIKHTNKMPLLAIDACLQSCGVTVDEVDIFAFGLSEKNLTQLLADDARLDIQTPAAARSYILELLEGRLKTRIAPEKLRLYEHHYAHAVTAYYPSPFESALVLTIDGAGGEFSGTVYSGSDGQLTLLRTFSLAQSLGHFYTAVTRLLGFSLFDEYKVMGLAPYGDAKTYQEFFKSFYTLLPEGNYTLYLDRLNWLGQICPKRSSHDPVTQQHKDVAAALQQMLEKIVFHIVTHFRKASGHAHLCLSGGVALNCTLNGKLVQSGLFDDVFVYPAASDCGLPAGSALAAWHEHDRNAVRSPLVSLFLGSGIGEENEISKKLELWRDVISVEKIDHPALRAAELLADNKVIGWVQGQSEFAPRALGHRSILADARPAENKERINAIVKKREGFRPFAPSVPEEYADEYFDLPANRKQFPYMMFVLPVREQYRAHLGAVTHIDGTARVQTVSRDQNPLYWQLITHFGRLTGTPVILNTSFNNNAEPIVDSVDDAIVSFLTTNLDFLVAGNYLVSKTGFSTAAIANFYFHLPAYMVVQDTIFQLANTYNEKVTSISAAVNTLLQKANGRITIAEAMRLENITEPGVLNEMMQLWEKRLIVIHPAPANITHAPGGENRKSFLPLQQ